MKADHVRAVIQQQKRLFREGLALLLKGVSGVEVVGVVATADELLAACGSLRPDVAVTELDAMECGTTEALAPNLQRVVPGLKVVALLDSAEGIQGDLAHRTGISAIVHRQAGFEAVVRAIFGPSAAAGPARSRRATTTAVSCRRTNLTGRETDVLTGVSRGWTSHDISDHLGISPKTVENHKQRIFMKLGVQNQAHAVALALRDGAITPERDSR